MTSLPRILVVDDELQIRESLREALQRLFDHVCFARNLDEVLKCSEAHPHDVILADFCKPRSSGIQLLQIANKLRWDCAIILMTGHVNSANSVVGVPFPSTDFPFKSPVLRAVIRALHSVQEPMLPACPQPCVHDSCTDLLHRTKQLEVTRENLRKSYRSALESLVVTLEAREPQTYAHSFRVRAYAMHLATLMNYPSSAMPRLAYAALLHDIGKIAVSDAILLKPGRLQADEFQLMQSHAIMGERIVSHMNFLDGADKVIRHHHESWDGKGYPDGLSGQAIPFESRLFSVADTLDAMTSDRCYRKAVGMADARSEIVRCAGSQFDANIAEALASVADDVWINLREHADIDARAALVPNFNAAEIPFFAQEPHQQYPATV